MFNQGEYRQEAYQSSSPNWRDINKNVANLVDDLEQGGVANNVPADGRWTPSDGFNDIRCDEDYEKFYRAQTEAGRKLPPPLDPSTVYQQLPVHLQQGLTPQQQAALASRLSPGPGGVLGRGGGLESINEQRPSSTQPNGLPPHMMQALNQIAAERGQSPVPNGNMQDYGGSVGQPNGGEQALVNSLVAAANALSLGPSTTPPPPMSHTPPLPPHTPPVPPMAHAMAYGGMNGPPQQYMHNGHAHPHGMQGMEYQQAAYQAAYQAALQQQQAAATQSLLMGGPGLQTYPGQHHQVAAQVAAQLAMQQGPYFGNPNLNAAAAAAATAALQNLMGGGRGANGMLDVDHDRRGRGRRDRRDRRDTEREREREREREQDELNSFTSRYQTLDEVLGQVLAVAKDQNGCRFLQRKFDEGGPTAIGLVFPEVLDDLVELMTDPFGNYLIQKLLDRCSEDQRLQVLQRAAEKKALVDVALNTHGTRAVQKLIETLTSREQVALVIESLQAGVVALIRDLNGNHVIQRCLQRLGPQDSQFVYDAAGEHAMEIATHRHGCCVLQRCIDFATPSQKRSLVEQIAANALPLSQDPFGNYVVQYVLELGHPEAMAAIINHLFGHFADLAQQKFSSNVVEKCLKLGGPQLADLRERIIRELLNSPALPRLLQDPYANYVVQSALAVSSGPLHMTLVDAIRPYLPALRGTPHGKRILSKINVKI